jgi:hypothetical protein
MTPALPERPRPRKHCDGCGVPILTAVKPVKRATGRRVCRDCAEFETGLVSPDWDC